VHCTQYNVTEAPWSRFEITCSYTSHITLSHQCLNKISQHKYQWCVRTVRLPYN